MGKFVGVHSLPWSQISTRDLAHVLPPRGEPRSGSDNASGGCFSPRIAPNGSRVLPRDTNTEHAILCGGGRNGASCNFLDQHSLSVLLGLD